MTRYWCGVASRDHIRRGIAGGFCQVNHGQRAPLARMAAGDGIVFYSPSTAFRGAERCQRFTAIGTVLGEAPYRFAMAPDFMPFRRDVAYRGDAAEADIRPLLDRLEFTRGKSNWGFIFRRGHFALSAADFGTIAAAMLPGSGWDAPAPVAAGAGA